MLSHRAYTALAILFLLLAIFSIVGLFSFLRKRAAEKENFSAQKEWYRFVAPFLLAIFFAFWGGHGMGMRRFWHWIYLAVIAVGLPFALAYHLNRDAFEKRRDRIFMLVAWLLLLNVAVFTTHWTWHTRNRAMDMDYNNHEDGEFHYEGHHLAERNWFLIPLWVVTIVFGAYSALVWRHHNDNSNSDDFLPM